MSLLRSAAFAKAVAAAPIVLVDVGARGGLGEPWRSLPHGLLRVVAFEPDPEEAARLNRSAPAGVEYVPAALWDSETTIELHVADVPSTSSVHPPDEERLRRYEEAHWRPRVTRSKIPVAATTLDRVLEERGLVCDFLKVDVQGAELEVLRGSSRSLGNVLAALVETWTVAVHRGQGRTGAVLEKLAECGLDVFDVGVAAAWYRRGAAAQSLEAKRQVTGLDLFALRDPPPLEPVSLAKGAAFAEAFGFPDVAASFLDLADDDAIRSLRGQIRLARRGRLANVRRRFASLHE
jgi:FkbM family methyltransferase